jgi:hypothetical protein
MMRLAPPVRAGDLVEADAALANQYRECSTKARRWVEWERGLTGRRGAGEGTTDVGGVGAAPPAPASR